MLGRVPGTIATTANALALWRPHGVGRALREVWERGGVLGGPSAGGTCWFEAFVTDSFGPGLQPCDLLGFLPWSFCPRRRRHGAPAGLRGARPRRLPAGYAVDDDAAVVCRGRELAEVVSRRPGAGVYRVRAEGTKFLPVRGLL